MSERYDSFQPRRATSVDGFLSGPGQRPRQPQFRTPVSPGVASAPSQGRTVGLPDMPERSIPSPVLTNSQIQPERADYHLDGSETRYAPLEDEPRLSRRQRRKAAIAAKKSEKKDTKRRKKSGSKVKKFFKILGVIFLVAVLAFGARFYKDIAKLTGNNNPFSLLGVFRPSDLQNDNGRVNVLVAGNSADDLGHNGGELTDSIMVLSINTKNNTALMLSVPRDLWVQKPEGGHGKINSVFPESGMEGLEAVVEDVTGLTIHYNALVNYTAFKDLVDAVGGITINIQSENPNGIYDSSLDWTSRRCCALAKYPNGPTKLDGKQALNLARARGEGYGSYGFTDADFTRTEHQRQMLLAIKDRASSASVVANPLKISNLVDAVGSNVRTDLQLSEMQALYYYGKNIDNSKIDSYNINTLKGENSTMLSNYASPDGQSALIPAAGVDNFADIAAQIEKIFSAGPLVKENAGVVILNGTDAVGLAKQAKNKLFSQGVEVLTTGDAPANQAATTIVDNSLGKKPSTLAYLKKTYQATVVANPTLTANYPAADFILILGENAVPKTDTTNTN
ncbi:LCP family protein [Candidatus Saccharibacteria bacterium]|nr:MAG: LCP family protein [Candidatus Saccharibacteria bacterium]